jgi:MEKHLA domain
MIDSSIDSNLAIPSASNNYYQAHLAIVLENLKRWTGYDLIQDYGFTLATLGTQVFHADFYLLSHNHAEDPILNYGNQRVLDLWEMSWEELIQRPSRETAKPIDRQARSDFMEQVRSQNYVSGYSGTRISKNGTEFRILDGTVWNVFSSDGNFYGQAAWFKSSESIE